MDAPITEFAVADAKARFSELLARAEAGEEIVIRRHGKPVAKLSPLTASSPIEPTIEEQLKSWDEWFAYRHEHAISLPEGMTIKDLIEDGRRF